MIKIIEHSVNFDTAHAIEFHCSCGCKFLSDEYINLGRERRPDGKRWVTTECPECGHEVTVETTGKYCAPMQSINYQEAWMLLRERLLAEHDIVGDMEQSAEHTTYHHIIDDIIPEVLSKCMGPMWSKE